jgi:cytochrome c553
VAFVLALSFSIRELLFVLFLVLVPTVPVTVALTLLFRRARTPVDASEVARGRSAATPFRLLSIVGGVATLAVFLVVLLVIGVRAVADPDDGQAVTVGGEPVEQQPRVPAQGNARLGQTVFAKAGCGDCHSLTASRATATIGPNLDASNPSFTEVVECVTTGPGDMPSFVGRLSPAEIRNVAKYVATVTPE